MLEKFLCWRSFNIGKVPMLEEFLCWKCSNIVKSSVTFIHSSPVYQNPLKSDNHKIFVKRSVWKKGINKLKSDLEKFPYESFPHWKRSNEGNALTFLNEKNQVSGSFRITN